MSTDIDSTYVRLREWAARDTCEPDDVGEELENLIQAFGEAESNLRDFIVIQNITSAQYKIALTDALTAEAHARPDLGAILEGLRGRPEDEQNQALAQKLQRPLAHDMVYACTFVPDASPLKAGTKAERAKILTDLIAAEKAEIPKPKRRARKPKAVPASDTPNSS